MRMLGDVYYNRINNEEIIVLLMKKLLDDSLKRRWAERAGDLILARGFVTFEDFVKFVRGTADRMNNRYGKELKSDKVRSRSKPAASQVTTLATENENTTDERAKRSSPKCHQCDGPHPTWRCFAFKKLSVENRWKAVIKNKLCRRCLDDGHFAKDCHRGFTCRRRLWIRTS
ncbi:uncharacterized protein LOC125563125 [Nematostella vectensis]|uniref:uncharacterized protein LOC125563125 n=1 Tax=Nematostella vectensis TaxID=45351 RepID=UPI0020771F21|nr:uncharacterized protein LOC125563125 [Nematostella vectensis]